ncbi:MAG: hypothetical protein QOK16_4457 [Solirubrobacteraceae bacterium]|jgi:hypothetical protein|nr:hypothetical protein [Solirubrobacteraceae bacterium]MEA2189446.1 hypothetical protein [Solirubrobacteraceae bacterium]
MRTECSDFCDSIERITGRKIRAFISGIDTVADVATETFVLHPPVTTAGPTSGSMPRR